VTTDSGFVETNGGRIYYEVDGDGEPVVLIHAGIANLRMWDGQVPALADRYRVIRYDTRGFGRTETEDVPFSNRDDITAVLASWASREPAASRSTTPSSHPTAFAR
jgi:3-oxoadipate enol-lactonase